MNSPRQLLAGLSIALLVVAVQTWRYPPDFLAFLNLWIGLALVASASCAVCAVRPTRTAVAISGTTVVTASAARGFGLVLDWLRGTTGTTDPGFIVGAVAWWMVALLAYIAWREYILPWAIARDRPR